MEKKMKSLRIYGSAENIEKIKGFVTLLVRDTGDKILTNERSMDEVDSEMRAMVAQYFSPMDNKNEKTNASR
jgi:hypothetical protein